MKKQHQKRMWMSLTMGNVVDTFGEVICQVFESLFKYHTLDIKWKYYKENRNDT